MADYYPLLARALDAMPDRSPALREAVYKRARGALIGQLRSLEPPLAEADIELESRALENAIERLERDHGGAPPAVQPPAPAPLPEPEPEPEPAPVEPPMASAPIDLPEAVMPPAPPPILRAEPVREPVADVTQAAYPVIAEKELESAEPAIRIQPRKGRTPLGGADAEESPKPFPAAVDTTPEPTAADAGQLSDPSIVDAGGSRQRPRIDVVAPRQGRSRLVRNVLVGSILLAVIGLIAVAAFLLRDKPADLQPSTAEIQDGATDGAESKYADRVGGDPAPSEKPTPAPNAAAPLQTAPQPDVSVSQRAVLYEEGPTGANAQPVTTQGRVVWRLENVSGEQGQPLETAVKATVDFPGAGLSLVMTMRRNLDATLPASHTIELSFTTTGPAGEKRAVQDIGLLQAKDEESTRGSPVSGLPVRVRENLFLIGLSSLRSDIDRNTELMLHKNWFDLAVKFTSGPRAIVALEKGAAGTQVLQKAFDQWH
ncbi:histidine kinase [Methylobacterium sp. BTF04]|uniref:histidine kinase n=1 Tax=Methylobacterium sp. BTF04 TaxID=2708300 RepID=UPI0013D556E7|nr:histidine kinase [Methylobacterium sp. BTF04]NEU13134.1 histidine kinase [Methylobacterium sp. BTF04]